MKRYLKFVLLIAISTLFLGIGYASITSISLEIEGEATLPRQTGLFISNVQYTSDVGADLANSNINTYYQNLLATKVTLSTTNANSNIVYTVTIYNDTAGDLAYQGIEYDPQFYDNNNIEVVVGGMSVGDIVSSGNSITFTVTYRYANGVTPSSSNNVLNSYISFKFDEPTWADLCDSSSVYLRCKMVSQNPQSDASINFSAYSSASNGRGLYYTSDLTKTEDLDGDGVGEVVYYYRGNVTNNYVRFDSYCWRIVRTNEDGSLRLIYGGTPQNNGNCPQTGSTASIGTNRFNNYTNYDNAYVGYMYGARNQTTYAATHRNTTNSTVKTAIDNWYNNNLLDSASYLADYPFCNDRTLVSGTGVGTNASVYAPQTRFYGSENNQVPTYKCNQDNDKFTVSTSVGNGALTYPIGMLTADEAVFAGAPYSTSNQNNTDSFLYTGAAYWLMSPGDIYQNAPYAYFINNTGVMRMYAVNNQQTGTRPVINLLPGVTVSGGTGAYNSPFVVNGVDNSTNAVINPSGGHVPIIENPEDSVESYDNSINR